MSQYIVGIEGNKVYLKDLSEDNYQVHDRVVYIGAHTPEGFLVLDECDLHDE